MPTNQKRKSRTRTSIQLDETVKRVLLYGEEPKERNTPAWSLYVARHFDDGPEIYLAAWRQHGAALLKENPRPWIMEYLIEEGLLKL
jgi:hypothetical protein